MGAAQVSLRFDWDRRPFILLSDHTSACPSVPSAFTWFQFDLPTPFVIWFCHAHIHSFSFRLRLFVTCFSFTCRYKRGFFRIVVLYYYLQRQFKPKQIDADPSQKTHFLHCMNWEQLSKYVDWYQNHTKSTNWHSFTARLVFNEKKANLWETKQKRENRKLVTVSIGRRIKWLTLFCGPERCLRQCFMLRTKFNGMKAWPNFRISSTNQPTDFNHSDQMEFTTMLMELHSTNRYDKNTHFDIG